MQAKHTHIATTASIIRNDFLTSAHLDSARRRGICRGLAHDLLSLALIALEFTICILFVVHGRCKRHRQLSSRTWHLEDESKLHFGCLPQLPLCPSGPPLLSNPCRCSRGYVAELEQRNQGSKLGSKLRTENELSKMSSTTI